MTPSSTCTAARACSRGWWHRWSSPLGTVTGIESDPAAVRNARQNLADSPWVTVRQADVAQAVRDPGLPPSRLVIADPPRAGLAREVTGYLTGDGPYRPVRLRVLRPGHPGPRPGPADGGRLAAGRGPRLRRVPDDPSRRMRGEPDARPVTGLRLVRLACVALGVLRPGIVRLARHVVPEAGIADQQAFLDQDAERLGAGLPGVTVLLAQRRDRRCGGARSSGIFRQRSPCAGLKGGKLERNALGSDSSPIDILVPYL